MSSLSYIHNGIKFENPFLIAPSPPSRNAELIMKGFKAGWGGAVIKTVSLHPEAVHDASPRLCSVKVGKNEGYGFQNIELISKRSVQSWIEDIEKIKDKFPEKVIVASLNNDAQDLEGWKDLTIKMQNAGADILQLNAVCPNAAKKNFFDISPDVVRAVKSVAKKPIWVKFPPQLTNIVDSAKVVQDAGADGFVTIDTIQGFSGVDINTFKPKLDVNGYSAYGGFSGKLIKPFTLRFITQVARACRGSYISGSGGMTNWEDAVEYTLLGCSSLQFCTEIMLKGFGIIKNLTKGMEKYLEKNNDKFSKFEDMIGYSIDLIKDFSELDVKSKKVAFIDKNKCIKCHRCYISSQDSAFNCINIEKDNKCKINSNCEGCGLCRIVCPENCITMIPKEL